MKVLALYAFLFLTVHMRRVQCSFIANIAHDNCQLMCQNVSSKECPYLLKVPRAETMDACPLLLELSHRSDVDQLEVQIDRFEKKIQSNIQVGLEREEWVETLLEKHEEFEAHMRGVQDSAHKTAVRLQRRNEELEEQKIDFMSEIGRLREKVEKFGRQGCTLDGDEYDYSELLHKSLLFYEAQRSGALPSNNRIAWRGDSALYDSGVKGEDLSGGYYDAGDFLKLGLPAAYASTVLAWGFIEFRDAYEVAGEANYMLDCLRWFTDYFIKCHTSDNELYVHVGLVDADHSYWGRPEDMTMARPAFMVNETHPGSDCVGETAAAMAAASIAFKEHDNDYAELLLDEARSLFHFADTYRGIYSDSVPEAGKVYKSNGYKDELTWAACWLYYATENDEYLEYALRMNSELSRGRPYSFAWNNVLAGVRVSRRNSYIY
uniref:cellulase n=1 Tax=Saccoglossus kowalevskii TaxID=10224 RepID=A0ABM0MXM0_SACKO|nr:PREDICTED: endoglucanase 7-like [Saccoglossus kowalevskii]